MGWGGMRLWNQEESGEGEEEVESGGEEEGSAKADSDSGSMWVCGI